MVATEQRQLEARSLCQVDRRCLPVLSATSALPHLCGGQAVSSLSIIEPSGLRGPKAPAKGGVEGEALHTTLQTVQQIAVRRNQA
jgi:hypothetical protein